MISMQKPDWALKYNYLWHSNPASRPNCRMFFDKCWVRPQVNAAWKVIKDTTQSSEKKDAARSIIDRFADDNANMMAGRTVQTFCDEAILTEIDTATALSQAQAAIVAYTPRVWDETDAPKHERRVDELGAVADHALNGLREALSGINNVHGEEEVWTTLPGCELPYFGKPDYSKRVELKTQWDRRHKSAKSGWVKNSLPRKPTYSHLMQIAGYFAGTNHPQTIVYANNSGYRVFTPENCPELHRDNLQMIVNQAARLCRVRETLLRSAHTNGGDIKDLLGLISPAFDHPFAWDMKPDVKRLALEFWDV